MNSRFKFIFIFLLGIMILTYVIIINVSCLKFEGEVDIIIRNGHIIDGTGNPWYQADIAIKDDKIVQLGSLGNIKSENIIEAKGLYVVPGFIDVHTHTDEKIDSFPQVKNYLLQGVTSVVGGNCGESRFPLAEFFGDLNEKGIAINFATLIGHNTIRGKVMGDDDRSPTVEELSKMQQLVKQEMLVGAIGLSTGLAYIPGRFSTTEEIIELVKVIQPFKGIYATHLRNQGKEIKEAIEEAVEIGREAAVPVQISHIKLANEAVWGEYMRITDPIERARKQGLEIYMDQYPYTATSSGFTSSFPGWAVAGGHEAFIKRLEDPVQYQKIKKALIERRLTSYRGINKLRSIFISQNKNHPEYEGKNLAEITDILGKKNTVSEGADLIIQMEKEDEPHGIFFQMTEEDVATLMQKPYNMIASDGSVEIPGIGFPHPRAYGTYPRILAKYCKELNVLSIPEAIRKMSSLPAQAMGFYNRGILKPGMYADIVIFSLEEIYDTATFGKPHQYPRGIHWVLVNGKIAAHNGEVVTKNCGQILYGSGRESN